MKSIKYLLCALLATAFVGCADDAAFEPGPVDSGASVYFPDQTSSILLMPSDDTEVEFIVSRVNTEEAATYLFEFTGDADGILVLETSELSFAAGAESATLKISFPSAEIGVSYSGSIAINDEQAAIYKSAVFNFSVMRSYTWVALSDASGDTTAVWTDELLGLYGVDPLPGSVIVYEAAEVPGYLKVVGAYSDDYFMSAVGVSGEDFGLVSYSNSVEIYIHAEDPNAVWIPAQTTGMVVDADYGEMCFASVCAENGFTASIYGTLADKVISFPAQSILVFESLYLDDLYYGNSAGAMGLALPGAEAVAEVAVSYAGMFTDATTKANNAVVNFAVNDGTASVKYALVEGKGLDIDALAAQIADGLLESVELTDFSSSVYIEVPAPGSYTIVAAPFNDKGTLGISGSTTFKLAEAGEVSLPISEGMYEVALTSSEGSEASAFYVLSTDDEDVFEMSDVFVFGTQVWYTCEIDRDNDLAYVTPSYGFNTPFAYYDEAQTMIIAYGGSGSAYDQPWVIELTEVDGKYELSSVVTEMDLDVYNATTYEYLGTPYAVLADAAITRTGDIPASAPAKAMSINLISANLRAMVSAKGVVPVAKRQLTKVDNLEVISRN